MKLPRLGSACFAVSCAIVARAEAGVLTVGASGAAYTNIQSAVDAAVEGDTILIAPGVYPAFTVDAKSLSIVGGDPSQALAVSGPVVIENLAAGQVVLLAGQNFAIVSSDANGLEVQQNAGSVRVQGLRVQGGCDAFGLAGFPGAMVDHSSDVAFSDATIMGGAPCDWPGIGGDALHAAQSSIALYGVSLQGADGIANFFDAGSTGTNGGAACIATDGFMFASGTSFLGGAGADGSDGSGDCANGGTAAGSGGNGGNGLVLSGTGFARLFDCPTTGGAAGFVGGGTTCGASDGTSGIDTLIAPGATIIDQIAVHRTTHVEMPSHEQSAIPFTFEGSPGDRVFLLLSKSPRFSYNSNLEGVSLVRGPAFYRQYMGTIDASGQLHAGIGVASLPVGVDEVTWYAQTMVIDAFGLRLLGGPATLVVLDKKF